MKLLTDVTQSLYILGIKITTPTRYCIKITRKLQYCVRSVIKAETEKKEKILRAEAEKEEKILKAQGEAEANKLLSKSITPELLKWRELDIQEKMAEAIRQNPHVRLFYGNSSFGNLHFWLEEKSKEDK